MLDNYFGTRDVSEEKKKRLLAVQAALEIAKAANSSSSTSAALDAVKYQISDAADAIQAALDK